MYQKKNVAWTFDPWALATFIRPRESGWRRSSNIVTRQGITSVRSSTTEETWTLTLVQLWTYLCEKIPVRTRIICNFARRLVGTTSPQDAVVPLRFAITPNVNEIAVEISAETIFEWSDWGLSIVKSSSLGAMWPKVVGHVKLLAGMQQISSTGFFKVPHPSLCIFWATLFGYVSLRNLIRVCFDADFRQWYSQSRCRCQSILREDPRSPF
jgi:hypothetical protein